MNTPRYGQPVTITPHVTAVNSDTRRWSCLCGSRGAPTAAQRAQFIDENDLANAHTDAEVGKILNGLSPDQFANALSRGASDSQHAAAVGLLIAHGHWMQYGCLRRYVAGGWNTRTRELYLRVSWGEVARECGEVWAVERIMSHYGDDGYQLAKLVRDLIEKRVEERGPDRGIVGSSSQVAVLQLACSLVSHGRVNLGDDLASLDNTNRGLVVTGLAHMLSQGGSVVFRSAPTWAAYHNGPSVAGLLASLRGMWEQQHRAAAAVNGGDPFDDAGRAAFNAALDAVAALLNRPSDL